MRNSHIDAKRPNKTWAEQQFWPQEITEKLSETSKEDQVTAVSSVVALYRVVSQNPANREPNHHGRLGDLDLHDLFLCQPLWAGHVPWLPWPWHSTLQISGRLWAPTDDAGTRTAVAMGCGSAGDGAPERRSYAVGSTN